MGVFDIKSYVYKDVDFSLMGNQIIRDIENGKSNTMVVFETEEEMVDFVNAYREVFDEDLASYWDDAFARHVFNSGRRGLRIDKASNELWIATPRLLTYRLQDRESTGWNIVYFKNLVIQEYCYDFEEFDESILPIKSLFCV